MSEGLLVRVAIDSTAGKWNAPCSYDGRFCYVPMGSSKVSVHMGKNYDPAYKKYRKFAEQLLDGATLQKCAWPVKLPRAGHAHFDPDFFHCTYGDSYESRGYNQRGRRIWKLLREAEHPFIVFYAALRSIESCDLVYSLIGFYSVRRVVRARDVARVDWHRNAHTRYGVGIESDDVVVFASNNLSGRLFYHVPIGFYSRGAWRIRPQLLREWGGVDIKGGYLQRGAKPPRFKKPDLFLRWFRKQKPRFQKLIHADNVLYPAHRRFEFYKRGQ
jgi:putative DNA base modification enzyme with NMAD domain